jgi:hypothetical protein
VTFQLYIAYKFSFKYFYKGITTDLESDLIEGMLCCDLGQINSIPNQNYGTFLDLIFSNASTDITVEICESPLLLDWIVIIGRTSSWWMYDLCKFEATSMDERGGSNSGLLTVRR